MKNLTHHRAIRSAVSALAFALLLAAPTARAATLTWNGTTSGTWGAANWFGGTPVNSGNDVLIFDGSTNLSTNNNLTSYTATSITFLSTAGAFTLAGNGITLGGTVTNSSATSLQTISLDLSVASGRTFTTAAGGLTLSGVISGNGGISKTNTAGTGLLTISGSSNSYTGVTTLGSSPGTLAVVKLANGGSNSSIGASTNAASNLVLGSASTLSYIGAGDSTDRLFNLAGSGATTQTISANGSGALNFTNTGAITYAGTDVVKTLTLSGTNTNNNTFSALHSNNGSAANNLTKSGAGTWILTGTSNNYTGVTTISAGILGVTKLANGGTASSLGASSNSSANLVFGTNATLSYSGTGDSTDRLFTYNSTSGASGPTLDSSGSGAVNFTNSGSITYLGTVNQSRTLKLGGTNTDDNTIALALGNNGSGVVALAKNDAGKWILAGSNSYTGATSVNLGTLLINGTHSGAGAITVANGAAFGRTGSTAVNLGGNVTFSDGSAVVLSLGAGGAHSSLNVTAGTWAFDSDQAFTFDLTGATTGTYTGLITGLTGSEAGLASIATWTITNPGVAGTFSYNSGSVDLNLTVIPEPSTWVLLGLAAGYTLIYRRRRLR